MEEFDFDNIQRKVDESLENFKKLKNSIINDPTPAGKKLLELNLIIGKEEAFKKDIKDRNNYLKNFLENREHDNPYDIKVIVLGGNNRVTIFRQLLLQFKNSKNIKFFETRPSIVYLNLSNYEMDYIGNKSNLQDEIKIKTSEVEVLKYVRAKYLKYLKILQEEKKSDKINSSDVWKYPIKINGESTSLSAYVMINKIIPIINKEYNLANTIKQMASFSTKIFNLLENILEQTNTTIFNFQFLLGKYLDDEIESVLLQVQDGTIKIREAKNILNVYKCERNFKCFISENISSKKMDEEKKKIIQQFVDSSEYEKLKNNYISLFKIALKFKKNPKSLIFQRGKTKVASDTEEVLKNQFIERLKTLKKNLFLKDNSSQQKNFEERLQRSENLEIIEDEKSLGLKYQNNNLIFFNDSLPVVFKPFSAQLLFCDIPYDNNEIGNFSDLDYNTPLDLEILVKSIKNFYTFNTNKNMYCVIFSSDDQRKIIKNLVSQEIDCSKFFHEFTWFKNKYAGLDLKKLPSKGVLKQTENFLLISFSKDITINKHELIHNNFEECYEIEVLLKNVKKILKDSKELRNQVTEEIQKHFWAYNKQSVGSNVFISPQKKKFQINDKILNVFEKPYLFLKNILLSFTSEDDLVYEYCFGSGSLGVACLKLGRSYIGYEKNENQFNGVKQRIQMEVG